MSDVILLELFLGILAGCAVLMTLALLPAAFEVRRTLRRASRLLPEAEKAVRRANRLLGHAQNTAARVDLVVKQACEAASGAFERFAQLKEQVASAFHGHDGNGSGSGPRRRRGA